MEKIIIIDGNSLANRAFYALPQLSASDGKIYNAVFGFCNIMIKLMQEQKPEYLVVAFDYGHKTFRNEIYKDYKGTRKGMPEELAQQFPVLKNLLATMGIKCLQKQNIEADDIIGTLCQRFKKDTQCIVVTGDRDSLQLIDDNVEVWLTKHGITDIISENKRQLMEDFGLTPAQVIDIKSLMGDSSDNIPGVPGIGEKTAKKLLQEYESMPNIYANINNISGSIQQKLIQGKELAEMSYTLATIVTDCDIQCELNDCKYPFPLNNEVREKFVEYEFRSLLKKENIFDEPIQQVYKNESKNIQLNFENIDNILNKIDSNLFSFFIEGNTINFAINKNTNYQINIENNNETIFNKFKKIFQNNNITKILYNKKYMLHYMDNFDIIINNAEDVSIGMYLINSNLREDDPKYVFDFLNISTETIASNLIYAFEYLQQELPLKHLDKLYYDIELPLVNVLYDMEKTGIKIDQKVLSELSPKYHDELKNLTEQIYQYSKTEFNISSPKQLAKVLFEDLGLNDKGNKKHSTAVDKLTELQNAHPIIPLIFRYRQISKLLTTYVDGMKNYISNDGKIHTTFNQTLAVTGRLSSVEPNLQNIPIRTQEGLELRKMFIPSDNTHLLLCADYSQIELRLLAHYSEDFRLCSAYKNNEDIHSITASQIFNIPIEKVNSNQRRTAKAVNFGIIYGISPFGLANNIGNITANQARQYMDKYFATYPTIKNFLNKSIQTAKEQGFVSTLFGRIRNINLSTDSKRENAFGERAAMNMPLQGTASDIIKLAMIQIFDDLKNNFLHTKMILQIHDELIFDVPREELPQIYEIVKNRMENVVNLHVPLVVDITTGENWFECDTQD